MQVHCLKIGDDMALMVPQQVPGWSVAQLVWLTSLSVFGYWNSDEPMAALLAQLRQLEVLRLPGLQAHHLTIRALSELPGLRILEVNMLYNLGACCTIRGLVELHIHVAPYLHDLCHIIGGTVSLRKFGSNMRKFGSNSYPEIMICNGEGTAQYGAQMHSVACALTECDIRQIAVVFDYGAARLQPDASFLAGLRPLARTLETLGLFDLQATHADWMAQIAALPFIRRLQLTDCELKPGALAPLLQMTGLERLAFEGCDMSKLELAVFCAAVPRPMIVDSSLSAEEVEECRCLVEAYNPHGKVVLTSGAPVMRLY